VRLQAGQGEPLEDASVNVVAFHNAFAADRRAAQLIERADGGYTATLDDVRPGLWEVRLQVRRGTDHFTHTQRLELAP
jgi:nitrogen fixation protein FixH